MQFPIRLLVTMADGQTDRIAISISRVNIVSCIAVTPTCLSFGPTTLRSKLQFRALNPSPSRPHAWGVYCVCTIWTASSSSSSSSRDLWHQLRK